MNYEIGSLVSARNREWVVLPGTTSDMLMVRPLGGTGDEVTGLFLPLEGKDVQPASFQLPDPADCGDYRSCKLLRDAMRLGFRSTTGPFRSFGRLGVDPRPYQLVPLLLALRQETVRLLVADDVGIGKTVEAGLIARELLDRGMVQSLAVICPPHLVEQWQEELLEKFQLETQGVTSGSAAVLERNCGLGQTIFDIYPHVVVSLDFIKSDKRRDDFKRTCPGLVIVDEAHTCAFGGIGRGRQQRHQLIAGLAEDPQRHIILVTATPHSGDENAFRSLISLLDTGLAESLEEKAGEPGGAANKQRRELAKHMVQRRRCDIEKYLDEETSFPERESIEDTYTLSGDYKKFFERVLAYARDRVLDVRDQSETAKTSEHRRRVCWWSVLALLRSLASSPAAAAAALRTRAASADTLTTAEADEVGRRLVLDEHLEDNPDSPDITPGTQWDSSDETVDLVPPAVRGSFEKCGMPPAPQGVTLDPAKLSIKPNLSLKPTILQAGAQQSGLGPTQPEAKKNPIDQKLLRMAREADRLKGAADAKLQKAVKIVKQLLDDGFRPIIFCRFIDTANYLAEELKQRIADAEVAAVTGMLSPGDREQRVDELSQEDRPVLVATDCLSEGINLQDSFNAVFHYDLSWNPTRHEQREGRVDRFGQDAEKVKVITYYGIDNQIDGIILDVLIRKHKKIREDLDVSIPIPTDTNRIIEAIFEGLLLRENTARADTATNFLPGFEEYFKPQKEHLHKEWEAISGRQKLARSLFAHPAIKVEEVARELEAVREAMGSSENVKDFFSSALRVHGGQELRESLHYDSYEVSGLPIAMKEALEEPDNDRLKVVFDYYGRKGKTYLHRTHRYVENVARFVLDSALDASGEGKARRCGVICTAAVSKRTTLLLYRLRFHMNVEQPKQAEQPGGTSPILAEECRLAAFLGSPGKAEWLDQQAAEALLEAEPDQNVSPDRAKDFLEKVIVDFDSLQPKLEAEALARAQVLADDHRRAAAMLGVHHRKRKNVDVEALLPADILGIYVYLPQTKS